MPAVATVAADGRTRDLLYAFRYRVYVGEQGHAPAGADHARGRLTDPLDAVSTSLALVDGGEVVGSLRFTPLAAVPDPAPLVARLGMAAAVGRFGLSAVGTCSRFMFDTRRPGWRRGMYRLMALGYGMECRAGRRLSFGDCGPGLVAFYEHMGFRVWGRPFTDPAYGEKVPIVLAIRDRDWLGRVRSPLARCARAYPDDPEVRGWLDEHVEFSGGPTAGGGRSAAVTR